MHRVFADGFGQRYKTAGRDGQGTLLEVLCFRHELTDVPSFEFALRERVSRLPQFHHPAYLRIRKVDRLKDDRGTVALIADAPRGIRLSEVLADAQRMGRAVDLGVAMHVSQQLVMALSALHEQTRLAHGTISPERVILAPPSGVCLAEYALGSALEQLKYSRERYWQEFGVALPEQSGPARLDVRADLVQAGMVTLALLLGRSIGRDEFPEQLDRLVTSACADYADRVRRPAGVAEWLRRALQLNGDRSFTSMQDAQRSLDQILQADSAVRADARSLETFLDRYDEWARPAAETSRRTTLPEGLVRFEPVAEPVEAPIAPEEEGEIDQEPVQDEEADDTTAAYLGAGGAAGGDDEPAESSFDEREPMTPTYSSRKSSGRFKWVATGLALAVLTTAGLFAARTFSPAAPVPTTGTITVNTTPAGAEVVIDGVARGRTPVSLSVESGAHTMVVKGADGEPRTISLNVTAGAQLSHHIDLPKTAPLLGQLNVRTDPPGVRISIDGTPLGRTPMTIADLAPGEHVVTLEGDNGSVSQRVTIDPAVPASLMVPMTAAAPAASVSGWISVSSSIPLDLHEGGRLIGNSKFDRIMLPAGRHEIELVNESLGYRDVRTVQVAPGRVAPISVALPKGVASINAIPWATVTIDGESVGETPIGNLPLTIGTHEVVFRNTQLGEQRRVITVTTGAPVRLSVDMAKR